ncbi:hypothetical protein OBBRIDRAFT_789430 [Obba rivulosa]|uniref:Uncharacterized protein n=1 Tax=Obba rivulosa TaxID=1052685 RepID=A0A8E2J480_9APHY|nr:hypothetical protein OBBRIDRAFT_789430 [Obba rivulosa]
MATPGRKRHTCRTCGFPMAGHKRPNRGPPVCPTPERSPTLLSRIEGPHRVTPTLLSRIEGPALPSPLRRRDAVSHIPSIGRYRNPSWVEPDVIQVDDDDEEPRNTPFSWVTDETYDDGTEKADEGSGQEDGNDVEEVEAAEEQDEDGVGDDDDDNRSQASTSSTATASTSASARIMRALSEVLGDSLPLASVFSTPRNKLNAVTDTARQGDLHTGLMRNPNRGQYRVRDGQLQRENSYWVVMGRDRGAVEQLLEFDEQDYETQRMVGAYPSPSLTRLTFFDLLVGGAMGGLVVWLALAYLAR